jgi:hypothetical protein
MRIVNHQLTDGAYQAGDLTEVRGEPVNWSFTSDKPNSVNSADWGIRVLLFEAPFEHGRSFGI